MKLSFSIASVNDIVPVVALMNEAAAYLTTRFGKGHWSYEVSEKTVSTGISASSKILVAKDDNMIIGTLRLTKKKPWAIDAAWFTKVDHPLYLVDMAVHPASQRLGVGRYLLEQAKSMAVSWPAQAIRLDAYDNIAGAGGFYHQCGFTEKGRVVYRKNPLVYFEWLVSAH